MAAVQLVNSFAELGIRQVIARKVAGTDETAGHLRPQLAATMLLIGLLSVALGFSVTQMILGDMYAWTVAATASAVAGGFLVLSLIRGIALGSGHLIIHGFAEALPPLGLFSLVVSGLARGALPLEDVVLYWAIAWIASAGVLFFPAIRALPHGDAWFPPAWAAVPSLLRSGSAFGIPLLLLTGIYRLDILLLERLAGAAPVAYYGVAVKIAELLWLVPSTLGLIVFSRAARSSHGTVSLERARSGLALESRLSLYSVVLASPLILALTPIALTNFLSEDYLQVVPILLALLPGVAAATVLKTVYPHMAGEGNPSMIMRPLLVGVLMNVALNLGLIPYFGGLGAAIASSLTYVFLGIIFSQLAQELTGSAPTRDRPENTRPL